MGDQSFQNDICIVGPGAVGLCFACLFGQKQKVWILGKEEHCNRFYEQPIHLQGTQQLQLLPSDYEFVSTREIGLVPPEAHFWICVKAFSLDESISSLLPYLTQDNALILVCNGLNIFMQASEQVRRKVPMIRALPSFGVLTRSATVVELSGDLPISLAGMPEHNSLVDQTAERLQNVGASVTLEKRYRHGRMEKNAGESCGKPHLLPGSCSKWCPGRKQTPA